MKNEVLLKDLISITKDGEWGKEDPADGFTEMSVIRGTDFAQVRLGSLQDVPTRHIPNKIASRKQLQPEDILIETAGGSKNRPTGRTVYLKDRIFEVAEKPITCASFSRFLRIDKALAHPEFVYWYLQHLYASGQMEAHQVQHTGIARFQYTKFAETTLVPLPPLEEQRAIAFVLGTLDDKIELNRRMNETLEEMARAIFKSWFVNFDPVRAKAEGRDPGLPEHIADLFPDRFEGSELGEIPAGWSVVSLDGIAHFLNGLALQKYPPEDDEYLPAIKIAELRKGVTESSGKASTRIPPKYVVEDGDVLFSWSGSLEVQLWTGGRGALNQHLFKVTSQKYPKWFPYFWLKLHLTGFRDTAADKATTMGHIKRHHLTDALTVVPPEATLQAMDETMSPIVNNVLVNRLEARTLASTRDALLPKLISGELRVENAECSLQETIR